MQISVITRIISTELYRVNYSVLSCFIIEAFAAFCPAVPPMPHPMPCVSRVFVQPALTKGRVFRARAAGLKLDDISQIHQSGFIQFLGGGPSICFIFTPKIGEMIYFD